MLLKNNNIAGFMKYFCCFIFILGQSSVIGQINQVLTLDSLMRNVVYYHPMSENALIQVQKAEAEFLSAKGNLDPSINAQIDQKYFDNKTYYGLSNGELKIPSYYGLDFKTGYEANRGAFLSAEHKTPDNGLWYAGVSLPLGQGLLIDERRASIRKAYIGKSMSELDAKNITNDLLFSAVYQYWDWFKTYNNREIILDALENATQRYNSVVTLAKNGDRPAIDTIEAGIQLQNITLLANQANLMYINASNTLQNFLWTKDRASEDINERFVPQPLDEAINSGLVGDDLFLQQASVASNPYLQSIQQKITQLEIDKALKKDKLKPKLNLQYNPITQVAGNNLLSEYSINNYKWGLDFKFPLFLRKERGELKLAVFKIRETELIQKQKFVEIQNKFDNYIAEWQASSEQVEIFYNTVSLYKQMLDAEKRLFDIGESSLFLVNTREQAYINANIKLTELIVKNKTSFYGIWHISGLMSDLVSD